MGRRRRLRLRESGEATAPDDRSVAQRNARLVKRFGMKGEPDMSKSENIRKLLDMIEEDVGKPGFDLDDYVRSLRAMGYGKDVAMLVEGMINIKNEPPFTEMVRIQEAINESRFDDAQRLIDEAEQAGSTAGRMSRITVLIQTGRLEEALALCDGELASEPSTVVIHTKAEVLREMGRMQEQLDLYDQWDSKFGGDTDFMSERARALIAAGRLDDGERMAVRALNSGGFALGAYLALGDLLMVRGDPAGAVQLYNQAIGTDENEPDGYMGKANALAALGEHERAVWTCNQMLGRVSSHRRLRETRDRIAAESRSSPGHPGTGTR